MRLAQYPTIIGATVERIAARREHFRAHRLSALQMRIVVVHGFAGMLQWMRNKIIFYSSSPSSKPNFSISASKYLRNLLSGTVYATKINEMPAFAHSSFLM